MPTTGNRREEWLLDLFLSQYDNESWAGALSARIPVERFTDGAVELVATRHADQRRLAIEHTLIEPFVGEKNDFHKHFKTLQGRLRADPSLRIPGHALYVHCPVGVLPHQSDWSAIIEDVAAWLRRESAGFPSELAERICPAPHHPAGQLQMTVRLVNLDNQNSYVIVHRHGDMQLDVVIDRALRSKLPKLVRTPADVRLLLLERDQGWVDPEAISKKVHWRRLDVPALASVDDIWIVDTASFGNPDQYVAFLNYSYGRSRERFEFFDGVLWAKSRNCMPLPVPRHPSFI